MSPLQPGDPVEERLSQMFVAFGQGSGPILMTIEAVQAARAQYRPVIESNLTSWDQHSFRLFEYARSLGRTTAAIATSRGATEVSAADYEQAASLTSRAAAPNSACPFC